MALRVKLARKDQLIKKLKAMPAEVQAPVVKATQKSADEVLSLAQRLVPADQGDLRNSGRVETEDLGLTAAVVFDKHYASFVEFGTRFQSPQPFLIPAYRALRKRVRGRMSRAVKKAVR